MRAIIIQDSDARALLDQLKIESMPTRLPFFIDGAKPQEVEEFNVRYRTRIETTRREMHHQFHFVVVRWLQEQGASITR